ncbi:maleylpyruvate isomerase N-terminal domain-containing protein [Saccharopolyspora taberi]|uniref:Mycothiol-dependent maleylpyruvate isomerase metal-binding domain-containing protein n=1 Tax=Saccharopolyspora taberi TaxID=60895 RepID=A0ABN3VPA0_9PSEU
MAVVVDSLEQVWRAWAELGASLDDEGWNTPTRLDGWTVKDVYAHYGPALTGGLAAVEGPDVDKPLTHSTAAELLREFQRPGGVAHTLADTIRDTAVEQSRAQSADDVLRPFTETAPLLVAAIRENSLDRRIDYLGAAVLTAHEGLRIALMEGVVHYLDIADALGLPAPGPVGGEPLTETVHLLADLADPVGFVEAASGRGTAQVLPVLR